MCTAKKKQNLLNWKPLHGRLHPYMRWEKMDMLYNSQCVCANPKCAKWWKSGKIHGTIVSNEVFQIT